MNATFLVCCDDCANLLLVKSLPLHFYLYLGIEVEL